MLKRYLKALLKTSERGDAREESFYPALKALLEEYALSTGRSRVHVTMLPSGTEAGNPDFRVWDGKAKITGYIEAKDPSREDLGAVEDTDQLRRYLHTFPNLILTNFYEFRLYRNGRLIKRAKIARPVITRRLKTLPPVENEGVFLELMDAFFSFSLPRTFTAKTLAEELAKRTRFLKDQVMLNELKEEEKKGGGFILGFYEAFQKYLIHGLSKEDFADLYSQTITYGLFAARTRAGKDFTRKLAFELIPRTIGILREVFRFISLGELPPQMEWIIDDISEVLSNADVNKILHDYFHEGKGRDPIVHFYETFLAEYDPDTRERRGVYYTPEPVVSYIVRSLDIILREKFGREDGFATGSVTVLDPAGGTLTFPAEAARLAVAEFTKKYGEGAKEEFIRSHILKNFYSFELMMAPYAIGHIKMGFLLEELGYRLKRDERFKSYLTNTLEMEEFKETYLPGMAALSEESHLAGEVKKDIPILVIMGNPPYSGHSANVGEWITDLIEDYKRVDGRPLGEKNPKWLQDDYVKFIRFAQWKIEQAGIGVIGFITNHSYLDNPTFRGMRRSLMESFDEIYVLDLHGNSLKKERCPDGSKDENVFDIRQGVSISLFVKKDGKGKPKIFHSEVWGLREHKYSWLERHDIRKTRWKRLRPGAEFYFFVPRDEAAEREYKRFWKITDIFPVNSVGIVTARDHLTIKWTPEEVWTTVLNFSKSEPELARKAYNLGKDARDWKVELAQKDLRESGPDKKKIVPILYRPFDIRYTYYTGRSRGFLCMPRPEVMQHMMRENLGLITNRQVNSDFKHTLCTDLIINDCTVSLDTRERSYLFPLYLYESGERPKKRRRGGSFMMLFEPEEDYVVKKANITPSLIERLKEAYKKEPSPEEIFYYIYAVLYSNIYRKKYAEFLKVDFPRVPFTKNFSVFSKMARYGNALVELHLMTSKGRAKTGAKFQGSGDRRVKKPLYDPKKKRVYINDTRFFEGVGKDVWEYTIGGYQVMEKWLKDRRNKNLSLEEIRHYCRMSAVIEETIKIQKQIDRHYPEIEKALIEPPD